MTRKPTAERQRQIAEAALDILSRDGARRFTTSALARRVGIAEGTIFRHFPDKAAIVRAAIDLVAERFAASFPGEEVEDPLERLGAFVRDRLKIVRERPGVLRLLFSDQLAQVGSEAEAERLAQFKRRSLTFMLEAFREARRRGLVRDDVDPESLFVVVHGAAVGMAMSGGAAADEGMAADPDRVWSTIEHLIRKPAAVGR
ncbi:MAG: TetR/AcrR family transcriptional regulator [Myxococcota bacterium]